MSLLDEMKPWTDEETKMIQASDKGRDNLVLHTARLVRRLTDEERNQIRPDVERFFRECEIPNWPGLLRRYPHHTGENSIDNLIGAVLLSYLLGLNYEHQALEHARNHYWVFNTESPGKIRFQNFYWWKDWYFKHAGIPPFLKVACKENLTLFDRKIFIGSIAFLKLFAKGTSDLLLQDDINSVMKGKYQDIDKAIDAFNKWVDLRYPFGFPQVNAEYYGASHPFANGYKFPRPTAL